MQAHKLRTTMLFTLTLIILQPISPLYGKEYWAGIYVSNNSGISYKDWKSYWNAYDYGFGWSFDDNTVFHLKADYLTHNYSAIDVPEGKLPIYYGIGAGFEFGSKVVSGIRVPVGANYLFNKIPFDAFIELAPMLHIYPATVVSLSGALGIRYHFKF